MTPETTYSVRELVKIPGMPGTSRGVQIKVKILAEKAGVTLDAGQGKSLQVPQSILPQATIVHLTLRDSKQGKKYLTKNAAPDPAELPLGDDDRAGMWDYYDRKPEKAKKEAQRRLAAIQAVEKLIARGTAKMDAYDDVAKETGDDASTLRKWLRKVRGVDPSDRLPALVPGYTGRMAKAGCSPEAWEAFKADYLRKGHPTESSCYDRLQRSAKKHGWTIPSLKTLKRRLERELSREAIILARDGEDGLKKCYPDQERDHGVFHALEAVNGDGYTFWPHVDFGDNGIVRPTAWVWQDIYSSRILAYRVCVSENTEMIRLSSGDMVERYGIPKLWWFDNTRAAANKTMTGGVSNRYRFKVKPTDPMGIVPMLGGDPRWATPGHGQAKPVERCFGVGGLSEYVDKHPAFSGRGTKKTPVPLAEFEAILADEISAWNARLGRRGRGMNGRSCDQVFAESYEKSTIRKATAEQRRLWLLACDNVTCNRDDASVTIKFYNGPQGENRYWSELLSTYAGRKITVRFDPQNLQGDVHCYTLDGRYIGAAQCILAAGFNDQNAAREHSRARNTFKKAHRTMLDAERRMTAAQAAALIPGTETAEPPKPKVVKGTFKKPQVPAEAQADAVNDRFARAVGMMADAYRESSRNKI